MTVKLQKFEEKERAYIGERDYLAVGYVEYVDRGNNRDELEWKVVTATGSVWFSEYSDAWDYLSEGLVKPEPCYLLP